jgi:hypothetical protein
MQCACGGSFETTQNHCCHGLTAASGWLPLQVRMANARGRKTATLGGQHLGRRHCHEMVLHHMPSEVSHRSPADGAAPGCWPSSTLLAPPPPWRAAINDLACAILSRPRATDVVAQCRKIGLALVQLARGQEKPLLHRPQAASMQLYALRTRAHVHAPRHLHTRA